MPAKPLPPTGEIILYPTEDGRTRVECRFSGETVWLTQALMAELYQKDVRTINEHLQNLFEEGELDPEATIRKFRTVRREGRRDVVRVIEHYNLAAILAVGYRARSPRGVQFRRWATERLRQNKLHFAATGETAAELIAARADHRQAQHGPDDLEGMSSSPRTTCARTRSAD